MATVDHLILKVNDLDASVAFYASVLGFAMEGTDGPFTVVRVGPGTQLQLAPWGTPGSEHYAFAVSRAEFERIFSQLKAAGIAYLMPFHSVGSNFPARTGIRSPRSRADDLLQRSQSAPARNPHL